MIVRFFILSEKGLLRAHNEDNFIVIDQLNRLAISATDSTEDQPGDSVETKQARRDHTREVEISGRFGETIVLAVSDGMGGALAGEVASKTIVDTLRQTFFEVTGEAPPTHLLYNGLFRADATIRELSAKHEHLKGMGTTFTAALVDNDKLGVFQVGDSRAYLIREGDVRQLTRDQTMTQLLIDEGVIEPEMAAFSAYRGVLLQVVGGSEPPELVSTVATLRRGDVLLLCSDGLSNRLSQAEIQEVVTRAAGDLKQAAQSLVTLAKDRGETDDITVLLAEFRGEEFSPGAHEQIEVQSFMITG